MTTSLKKSKYPQAPPFADQHEIETFLSKPLLARLCTHNEDGTIHIAPLYFLYSKGEFLLGTQHLSRKVKNIQHHNRVTILIDSSEPVIQAVMVYGEAVLDYDDVIAKRVKILGRYYPSLAEAQEFAERLAKAWKTVIIRVKPTKFVSVDYSKPFSIE